MVDVAKYERFYKERFKGIQVLRGIAALLVVLEHIRFLNFGAFGVDMFFIVSGFVIMFVTSKGMENFLKKRIVRVVPFYYLMTFGTFILLIILPGMFEQTTANPVFLIKSLLFIPFDVGAGAIQPILRIGWTINCEMFFYMVFAIAGRLSHKYRGIICSSILFLLVMAGSVLKPQNVIFIFYSNPIMLEFILGILCFYIVRWMYCVLGKREKKAIFGVVILIGAFLLIIMLASKEHKVDITGFGRLLYWGVPALFVVIAFFGADALLSFPKWAVRLGDISFSVYLIHYYVIMGTDRLFFDFSAMSLRAAAGAVVSITLTILLASVTWFLIENKLTNWIKKGVLTDK